MDAARAVAAQLSCIWPSASVFSFQNIGLSCQARQRMAPSSSAPLHHSADLCTNATNSHMARVGQVLGQALEMKRGQP